MRVSQAEKMQSKNIDTPQEAIEPRQVPDLARPALVLNADEGSEVIY